MEPTRVLFIGSKSSGLECVRAMYRVAPASVVGIVTLDDRHDSGTAYEDFEIYARTHGIPLVAWRIPSGLANDQWRDGARKP